MTSIQERLQMKREPLDKWSLREQLCLASAVARSGDQNWMSVSRALKPFGDSNRPSDWFHQKNCAAQYGALLSNVETPKRKKRTSMGSEVGIETPAENILRRLLAERQAELKKLMEEEKAEYCKLQEDMAILQSGKISEEELDKWCKEIDEEEQRKIQENITHNQWLKEREQKKQEIERAWRPAKPTQLITGQKRKNSDAFESMEVETTDDVSQANIQQQQDQGKPALSPLLTSLLKSPSQVQNVQTSILHSAITNQQKLPTISNTATIASLLNSSSSITNVSPGLQQLVSSAIGQEQENIEDQTQPMGNDILDDPNLPNLKIDDLASSILDGQDGPLPEIKKEEVDDIISEIIENAHDIVTDPEQHLQLDGNGDININLELDDFDDEPETTTLTEEPKETTKEDPKDNETSQISNVDPFEFQEDPFVFEPAKPNSKNETKQYQQQPAPQIKTDVISVEDSDKTNQLDHQETIQDEKEIKKEVIEESPKKVEKSGGSVEIVEVLVVEEEEIGKEFNKSQIQDIVHSIKTEPEETKDEKLDEISNKPEVCESTPESKDGTTCEESSETSDADTKSSDIKKDTILNLDTQDSMDTSTPDFTQELYDDVNMEVKVDKSGKVKRDYSRTKKKEDKTFDMLLINEKAQEESDLTEENTSDKEFVDEKKDKLKPKIENERSSSPWTEEEDMSNTRSKRRYSTPATPIDSVPNSPASSIIYEDDRDYRNWKKSVMLVYNRLVTHKYASLFLKPITEDYAPGYNNIVYRPMDLQTIKKNIENGVIRTTQEFKRDVMLMYNNALMYNKATEIVYNMALQMQQESLQPIEILLQATSQADTPLRRETRTSESGIKRKRATTEDTTKNKKRKED